MNFITKLVTTAFILPMTLAPAPAEAFSGCYQSLAAHDIATMIRGGASPEQAIRFAVEKGNINSESCLTSTIGYMRGMRSIYGDVLR